MNPIHPFLVLTTNLLLLGEALANPGNHASKAKTQQQLNNVGIAEWVAFGSGCQASSKKPSPEVQFTTQTGETLLSTLHFKDFRLNLKDTDKGVRECALRMTVEMPPNKRIASIQAQTHIEANKTDGMHLRARVMMLLGDSQIANRVWDLKKNDFAKHRNEQISLLSGSTSETALPKKDCGKPQIIGLDYTFEGLEESNSKPPRREEGIAFLRLVYDKPTLIEVFFESCGKS